MMALIPQPESTRAGRATNVLSALKGGEGGDPPARRRGGWGGCQQLLWHPPPHPGPLRPQGRGGSVGRRM